MERFENRFTEGSGIDGRDAWEGWNPARGEEPTQSTPEARPATELRAFGSQIQFAINIIKERRESRRAAQEAPATPPPAPAPLD